MTFNVSRCIEVKMQLSCILVIFLVSIFHIELISSFDDNFKLLNDSRIICANFLDSQESRKSCFETIKKQNLSKNESNVHPELFCVEKDSATVTWSSDKEYDELAIQISSGANQSIAIYSLSGSQEKYFHLNDLRYGTRYQVLILGRNFTSEGIFREDVAALNFTTIGRDWKLPDDFWFNVTDFSPVNETHTNVTMKWNSSSEVLPCQYTDHWYETPSLTLALPEQISCGEFDRSECILPNLKYSFEYILWLTIYDQASSLDFHYRMPSCSQVASNKNWTCSIAKIEKISTSDDNCTEDLYCTTEVSWIFHDVQPDYFNVTLELRTSRENWTFYETKNVTEGNNVIVRLPHNTTFRVTVSAHKGNVTSDPTFAYFHSDLAPNPSKTYAYGIVFSIILLIIFALSVLLYFNRKPNDTPRLKKLYKNILIKNMEIVPPYSNIEVKNKSKDSQRLRLILGKVLGKGNFGIVLQGTLITTNGKKVMDVAVKTLQDNATPKDIEQFGKEISLMEDVGIHNNIVSMIGSYPDTKRPLLIVEYCALGDLHAYLCNIKRTLVNFSDYNPTPLNQYQNTISYANGDDSKYLVHNKIYGVTKDAVVPHQLSICDLLSFSRQVAKGMEYLASTYVIHRDLAARNILLCGDKTVKISDFGLSRDIYAENIYRKLEGGEIMPIKWMALESICNREYSTLSDVWSFGIFLWELFTMGDEPYPDISVVDVLVLQLKAGYRMHNPCPSYPQIYEIMLNCWHEHPELRPQFSTLHDLLDQILKQCSPNQYITITGNED
ncbi:vascular endothelial growth factor receptor 3-like [Planococcus citri]|uniref:vascular endothelial growth factor receptor 3-like n=1 Tax=Planococcus citri TaxID=170843 RepID=UPI0031F75D71